MLWNWAGAAEYMWKTRVMHGCCFFVQQFFLLDSQSNPVENVIVQGLKLIRDLEMRASPASGSWSPVWGCFLRECAAGLAALSLPWVVVRGHPGDLGISSALPLL